MTASLNPPFSIPLRVYIEDTDAGGIVYYVNYLKFMERARTEFMRHLGYGKSAVLGKEKLMVVHSANVQYRKPATLDDALTVTASLSKLARSYVVFRQEIFCDGELLCTGDIKVACVTQSTFKPVAIPEEIRETLKDHLSASS